MVTVIVTIHGIGFQVPPKDKQGVRGYADDFHLHLNAALGGEILGDDPERLADGVRGPIYVHSNWPPGSGNIELGIARLGRWVEGAHPARVTTDTRLVNADQPVAHVALVYANLEEKASALGPLALITLMSLFRLGNYASVLNLIRMLVRAGLPLLNPSRVRAEKTPSLQPRHVERLAEQPTGAAPAIDIEPEPTGLLATIRQLENDVAAYVTRNSLRQRVRAFVTEALLRLAYRPDVDGIIVNSHSQGTAVAFDVLRDFPVVAHHQVKAFVTAGSPLRKYTDLFVWGREIGCIYGITGGAGVWSNFWDDRDPVADSLNSPDDWQPGHAAGRQPEQEGLFRAVHPERGELLPYWIDETQCHNLKHSSGGGLQAHNYWDNTTEFVPAFAKIVRSAAGLVQ
jgi:hypothetical protein